MKKIGIGVLAYSSIAKRRVLPVLQASERFSLIAVGSRSSAKALEGAKKFDCAACSYNELIEDESVDAIYISLPVGLHYEWGIKALEAGKHIIVEKTFVGDFEKARNLIALAEKSCLVAMEALSNVHHPHYRKVLQLLNNGTIGEIRHIQAYFGFPFLPEDDVRHKVALGGGAILDALIYPLNCALEAAGTPPQEIQYSIGSRKGFNVDTHGFLQLNFGNCQAQIGYGFGFSYRNECHLWGTQGRVSAQRLFSLPPDMSGEITVNQDGSETVFTVDAANQFDYMLNDFADAVNANIIGQYRNHRDLLCRESLISTIREASMCILNDNMQDRQSVGSFEPRKY